jgi:hypothetical protein
MAAKTKSATRPKGWKRAAYILRTCNDDLTSYGGFQWSEAGLVEAPDWRSDDRCGRGLHGFLNGEGDGGLANFADDAKWIVAEIEAGWVDLSGKVKFPRAFVVHCGDRLSASEFLTAVGLKGAFVGGTATAGYRGTATAGYRGTATAGDEGTATAGYRGTATAGYRGTATAGYRGTATAGYRGTATAGDAGTATAGDAGTATAGDAGTATAGYRGTVLIRYWDESAGRYRIIAGYIGEDGIEPNKAYRVSAGKLVAA